MMIKTKIFQHLNLSTWLPFFVLLFIQIEQSSRNERHIFIIYGLRYDYEKYA